MALIKPQTSKQNTQHEYMSIHSTIAKIFLY